jgi:hypothetical protein
MFFRTLRCKVTPRSLHHLHVTRNHADCVGNDCTAVLRGHFRSLLAQFGLAPKSKRRLAASDSVGAVDPLDAL